MSYQTFPWEMYRNLRRDIEHKQARGVQNIILRIDDVAALVQKISDLDEEVRVLRAAAPKTPEPEYNPEADPDYDPDEHTDCPRPHGYHSCMLPDWRDPEWQAMRAEARKERKAAGR